MSKKKQNGNEDKSIKTIILVTAIISLINAITNLIDSLVKSTTG